MSQFVLDKILEKFSDAVVSTHSEQGDDTAVVDGDRLADICKFLKDDPQLAFEMLMDLTAVDYLGKRDPRFEVVYHLKSLSRSHRVRLKVRVGDDNPSVPTVIHLWKSAYWMEREVWDLYGIKFQNHPDLRRILLYPEFEGHPLRKDYPMEKRQPLIPPRPGQKHL